MSMCPEQLIDKKFAEVSGFEGKYLVTTCGLVYSNFSNKFLKPKKTKLGYLNLCLRVGGCSIHKSVHRLVAEAFIENPEGKPQVNHKDGVKTNNSLSNLEWCTSSENLKHAFKVGLRDGKGSKHSQAVLTERDIPFIRHWLDLGYTLKSIGDPFGVGFRNIHNIKVGKSWRHV